VAKQFTPFQKKSSKGGKSTAAYDKAMAACMKGGKSHAACAKQCSGM